MESLRPPLFGPDYSPKSAAAIASCSATISALDARISVSSVGPGWHRRALWSGYAAALKLQSVELDEIDVFSWGCGMQLATRPRFATNEGMFDLFSDWEGRIADADPLEWRDGLPLAIAEPDYGADHPPLIRALEQVRRHSRADRTALPWLGLPFALRDKGLTTAPLPCLVGGAKAFRLKPALQPGDWTAVLASLQRAALSGLARLDMLERSYREAMRAIAGEYRVGKLPSLLALALSHPLLSPKAASSILGVTVAGASKLLERAVEAGLLVEVSKRRSWRQFLPPDLAAEFGLVSPKRGRPRKGPPPLPLLDAPKMSAAYEAFDLEMERIDALLARR